MDWREFITRIKNIEPDKKWEVSEVDVEGVRSLLFTIDKAVAFAIDERERLVLGQFTGQDNLATNLILDFISEQNRPNVFRLHELNSIMYELNKYESMQDFTIKFVLKDITL